VSRLVALTRPVPESLARCELTHLTRVPIDIARARAQHAAYERTLAELGCTIVHVDEAPDLPDSVFIEDAAVVLDEIAIVTRPGAPSRRGETSAVAEALAAYRPVAQLTEPATLDGGDVLRLWRTLFVGAGGRTNTDGIAQLAAIAGSHGYDVRAVPVHGCLHLKSAVTMVSPGVLIANPAWVETSAFDGWQIVDVDPSEPPAANVLSVDDTVLVSAAFPRTAARLEAEGFTVRMVDVSELAKAEAALTCCSVMLTM
jgi:dimethylargininase